MFKGSYILVAIFSFSYFTILKAENAKTKTADVTPTNYQDKMTDVDIEEIMNQCNESFRMEMSYLEALNESGSFPDETDKTPKCYLRCVLENAAVMSMEGEFDADRTSVLFAGERGGKTMEGLKDMAMNCSNRKETCKCERAYNYLKCLMTMELEKYENKN